MIQTVNMIFAEDLGLLMPVAISLSYVKLWPKVTTMPRLTATIGAFVGIVGALAIFSWVNSVLRDGPCEQCPHDGSMAAETWRRMPIGYLGILIVSGLSTWLVATALTGLRKPRP